MTDKILEISQFLSVNSEQGYRDFSAKLIPDLKKEKILGVRAHKLRSYAKQIKGTNTEKEFINSLPHRYLEENHLHAYLICCEKDFKKAVKMTKTFLPYVDNWATCDGLRPKVFAKHIDELYPYVLEFLDSKHTYTVRYGIGLLNSFYLDSSFDKEHIELLSRIQSEQYYINMMIAWYLATALFKQYDTAVKYIENKRFSKFVHNKAIQKACESFRVSDSNKAYLRTLKIK